MLNMSKNLMNDIIDVCHFRTACNLPCRRCKYQGAPCDKVKHKLLDELIDKIYTGDTTVCDFDLFLNGYKNSYPKRGDEDEC